MFRKKIYIRILLQGVRNVLLASLNHHDGDMEEKLRGHSWLLLDLTVNWQRCLVLNIFIWNTSPIIEYLGSTSSPPCLHYLLQGSYKDVLGIWWINFQDPIQESNQWCHRYQIHIVTLSPVLWGGGWRFRL